jgi:SAM-dependent methyltransferase
MSAVIWHDVECGAYEADLPLWRELAAAHGTPVLDIGAGTGRVALDLASHGHDVVAVDLEPELLAALDERAAFAHVAIPTHAADARHLDLGAAFPLVLVPMQTVQLLGGPDGRAAFLAALRRHLTPDGVAAIALADALEAFDEDHLAPPVPDMREIDGVVYSSLPVSVQDLGPRGMALHRLRETVQPDGTHRAEEDTIVLDALDPVTLEAEARQAGLRVLERRAVPPTEEYVGSAVVMLGA